MVIRVYILSVAMQPGGCIFSNGVSIIGKYMYVTITRDLVVHDNQNYFCFSSLILSQ